MMVQLKRVCISRSQGAMYLVNMPDGGLDHGLNRRSEKSLEIIIVVELKQMQSSSADDRSQAMHKLGRF